MCMAVVDRIVVALKPWKLGVCDLFFWCGIPLYSEQDLQDFRIYRIIQVRIGGSGELIGLGSQLVDERNMGK